MNAYKLNSLTLAVLLAVGGFNVATAETINGFANENKSFTEETTVLGNHQSSEANDRYVGIEANGSAVEINHANGALNITSTQQDISGTPSRIYGISSQQNSSLTINGAVNFEYETTSSTEIRVIRAIGGDVTISGATLVDATGADVVTALDAWDGTDVHFSSDFTAELKGENSTQGMQVRTASNVTVSGNVYIDAIGNVGAAIKAMEGSTVTVEGNTELRYKATADGRLVGVENYNNQGGTIRLNGAVDIIVENTKASSNVTQGILGFQSNTIINGNANINVIGGTGDTYGVDVQCNPGLAHNTLVDFQGAETSIDVSASKNASGTSASGSTGAIQFNEGLLRITATSSEARASGITVQYGGTTTIDSKATITVKGPRAYGLLNFAYDDQNKNQSEFGLIKATNTVAINVEGDTAMGVATFVNSAAAREDVARGIFLEGQTVINAKSTDESGSAIGIYMTNENAGEFQAETQVNELVITAVGENGAESFGVKAESDAIVGIHGNATILAQGDNATGIYLTDSSLTLSGTTAVKGDSVGVEADDETEIVLNKDAVLSTNSMQSTGTTTMAEGSKLEVTGTKDGRSVLGAIDATKGTISVGAGAFSISTLTGDDNSLVLNDLANTKAVDIATKTGSLNIVTNGASNDRYANVQETADALLATVNIGTDNTKDQNTIEVKAGYVNDALSATVTPDGTLTNVTQTKNDKLDAFASVTALSAIALRHEMNSLSKRMGELRDSPAGVGAWVRAYGSEMEYGVQNITAKNTSIQVGSDYSIGDWKVGAAFTYTDGESTYQLGSADNKGYGFALYGTWFVPCGAYVDLMAKYNRLDNDFALNGMNGSIKNDAFGFSAETGYRFNFLDDGLFVEPQIGLSYGHIKGEAVKTINGVTLAQDDYDSLMGRAGVRTGFKFPKDKGNIYARISGVYDFDGEMNGQAQLGKACNTFEADLGGAWLEVGVGANFNMTKDTYAYVDLERTNGGNVKENYRWNIGVRHSF